MSKLVVINLERGNLNEGFYPVTAQIWEGNNSRPTKFTASLPAAPELLDLYQRFQLIYTALSQGFRKRSELEIETVGLNNVSEIDFSDICRLLKIQINNLLNSNSFRLIDQQLRARLALNEEFQVIIETSDNIMRRLPWHLWNFFEDYQKAEIAISSSKYEKVKQLTKNTTSKVRILAILGNSTGIDIQQDRMMLERLPNASCVFLVEPSRSELDKCLWEKQGWDILFFAGHSSSDDEKGQIYINQNSSLTIYELKNALKYALTRGLKLAIFNSCNGLGLAQQLADLHIPQIIVMRENVPDLIAQAFLKYFLLSFASGQSLYLAVRYARERLQGLEDDFPAASWLPIICQNPAEEPPTWDGLRGLNDTIAPGWLNRQSLQLLFLVSIVITNLIFGMRSLGVMQSWELLAFDAMMQMRPDEGMDQRLLAIMITEADIQAQNQKQKTSLSDATLQQLLQKLTPYQPQVIGLDIYRDFPVDSQYPELATRLQHNNELIAICKVSGDTQKAIGISPPPEVSGDRVGFSDVLLDQDYIMRRHLLFMNPSSESPCKTNYSLSFQLARQYLAKQGIQLQITNNGFLQLGSVVFKPIDMPTGAYQTFDARGHQILLNSRSTPHVVQQVTLSQVLNDQVNPEWIRDRIILIGVDAESVKDTFFTPYIQGNMRRQEVPGVIIHAQMVSQILSAVLDNRPLLWVWPVWSDFLWIWSWSLIGGLAALYRTSPLRLALISSTALITLYSSCFVLLFFGAWIPFVPSVLALMASRFGFKASARFFLRNKVI